MTRDRRSGDDRREIGPLLRGFRTAAGLTQEALAERAGVGVRSIQGFELGERQPRRDTAQRLVDALGLVDADRARFEAVVQVPPRHSSILRAGPAASIPTESIDRPSLRHDLPVPLSSFVGRTRQLAELERCLGSSRLLTLTGPPGVGKTRLALAIATRQGAAFGDGVQFVPLAAIRDPEEVFPAIARSIGVEGTVADQRLVDRLADVLREARLLLVLDNFEQVATAGARLSQLLEACPRLVALVTSRARLRVRGEREFVVPPLTLPADGAEVGRGDPPSWILGSEAGCLFVERAREARSDFDVTPENAPAIAEICRGLDGSPLAIELAAAWVRTVGLPSLLARLTDRLGLLTAGPSDLPDRQQTWRAAITWSYDLLSPDNQALFRRLAVFSGGFTFAAAEAVAQATLAGLASLLDTGLVQRVATPSESAEPRFALLETIRDYAGERLVESGEAEALRRQHAEYFITFGETIWQGSASNSLWKAWDLLESERANLRAALRYILDQADAGREFYMKSALFGQWIQYRLPDEAQRWGVPLLELA